MYSNCNNGSLANAKLEVAKGPSQELECIIALCVISDCFLNITHGFAASLALLAYFSTGYSQAAFSSIECY